MPDPQTTLYSITEAARQVAKAATAILKTHTDPSEPYDRLFECYWSEVQRLEGLINPKGFARNEPRRKDVARLFPQCSEPILQQLREVLALHDEVFAGWHYDGKVKIVERSDRFEDVRLPLRILNVRLETLEKMLTALTRLERLIGQEGEQLQASSQSGRTETEDGTVFEEEWRRLRPAAKEIVKFLHKKANRNKSFKGEVLATKVGKTYGYLRSLTRELIDLHYICNTDDGYRAGRRKPPR